MRCEYVVTFQDFEASLKLYRKISRQALVGYLLYVWLIPTLCVASSVVVFYLYSSSEEQDWSSLVVVSALLGVALALPARYRLGVRRAFKQRNVLTQDRPMYLDFDEQNVRFIVPLGTEITYQWKTFTDYREAETVAVLFIKDAAFHTIPKRAMDDAGWSEVRRLVGAHVRGA